MTWNLSNFLVNSIDDIKFERILAIKIINIEWWDKLGLKTNLNYVGNKHALHAFLNGKMKFILIPNYCISPYLLAEVIEKQGQFSW